MKKLLQTWRRAAMVIFGAVILSTLGIQASDELSGVTSRLSGSVIDANQGCDKNSLPILFGTHTICMDVYEASPSSGCLYQKIESTLATEANMSKASCEAVSETNVIPWRFVTYTQAQQLCARAGKRLPTNAEWYKVALGLPDPAGCFNGAKGTVNLTGTNNCLTPTGIHDLVGGVWEWMDDVITEGYYKDRILPESGYVTLVDAEGVVIKTDAEADSNFGEDYAWISHSGVRGILRGGFYGSASDGGIFAQNMAAPLDFAAAGVGFRCVRDI